MSPTLDALGAPRVSAIVVAHDGERWLPHLIAALEGATRSPDRVIAVDTGSVDASRGLLEQAFEADSVISAPVGSGFGHAVEVGVAALDGLELSDDPANEWLWLLHDDCSPSPEALERLLDVVREIPDVSVVGCRMRAWPRARRLLEVGVTITGTGHRETGLELGEYDQGQHDGVRTVLSVSSAGMLVRRSVWNALGGFDRRLPLFRDDVDFGWRAAKAGARVVVSPDAIMFHAEAAARGVRNVANTSPNPHRADRRAALFTLLANCSLWALPFQYVRLFLGSLVRSFGYLVGKLPTAAYDELAGSMAALGRPDRIVQARLARRGTRVVPRRQVRALLPAWWTPYANGIENVASRFAESLRDTATNLASSARRLRGRDDEALETGPVDDEAVGLPVGAGPVDWVLTHPVRCLVLALAVLAPFATRGLWGSGSLNGGGLLPTPDGASQWWRLYIESWHPVALGSTDAASPYVAALAAAATVVIGKTWLVVDLLMLFSVPLAAWGAFMAARRLVARLSTQAWLALSYGLLPVVTGAVTAGRVGTVVATLVLPWLVRALVPILDDSEESKWRSVFVSALLLATIVAFCPLAWVTFGVVALAAVGWLASQRAWTRVAQLAVVGLLPLALLAPWSLQLLDQPSRFFTEAGALDPKTAALNSDAWQLVFGRVGAPGDAPWWLSIGFAAAALVALLRADRRRQIAAAWVVIAASLATVALFVDRVATVPGSELEAAVWWGFPVIVAQAAALLAIGLAADGVTVYIQSGTFGWRQPLAAATAVVAAVSPLAGLAWWVVIAPHGELERSADNTLPAYLVDTMQSPDQQRVLVLRGSDQAIEYDVLQDDGLRLGDDSVGPAFGSAGLDALIGDVLSEGPGDGVARLADFGIGYVVLPTPADPDVVSALDGLPGLARASTDLDQLVGWQLAQPTGLARLYDPSAPDGAADAEVLGARSDVVSTEIPDGEASREVVLAALPADDIEASLDGEPIARVTSDDISSFAVGGAGGDLAVHASGHRTWWLVGQGLCWFVVAVLATPSARRREGIAEVEV